MGIILEVQAGTGRKHKWWLCPWVGKDRFGTYRPRLRSQRKSRLEGSTLA